MSTEIKVNFKKCRYKTKTTDHCRVRKERRHSGYKSASKKRNQNPCLLQKDKLRQKICQHHSIHEHQPILFQISLIISSLHSSHQPHRTPNSTTRVNQTFIERYFVRFEYKKKSYLTYQIASCRLNRNRPTFSCKVTTKC